MKNTFTATQQEQSLRASVPMLWLAASYFALEAGSHLLGNLQLLNDGLSGFLGMLNLLALLWFGAQFCRMPAARWFGRQREAWLGTYTAPHLRHVYQQACSKTINLVLVGLLLAYAQQQWLPALPAMDAGLWLMLILASASACLAYCLHQALPGDCAGHAVGSAC